MASDWIKRLADDERKRDEVRFLAAESASRKADLVRVHGRRLLEELRTTVTRDVEAFRQEFAGDQTRKPEYPAASLNVAPRFDAAAVGCQYRFTPNNGLPPREDRLELVFAGEGADSLQMKHHGTGQLFATPDALSEYLLSPVFTGRPR